MAKIHITLVGGQTAPVYLGIIDVNPDKVILIYSDQTIEEASRIYAEIQVDCELKKIHPVDFEKIDRSILELKNLIMPTDEVTINVGGGTKPWALMFYKHFAGLKNTSLIYVDQNNLVWDLDTKTQHEVAFDMDLHFKLYGNPLTEYKSFEDYTAEDAMAVNEIKALRSFNFQDFNEITAYLYKNPNSSTYKTVKGSSMDWISADNMFVCNMKKIDGCQLQKSVKSPNIRSLMLNTGWFEYEIAAIISQWVYNKEIRMNCIFPASKGSPKNEIDLIINTGTKLLFVECKTQIYNETDIDKFASAVKVYGGMGSKALFVTDPPMKEKAIEKCNDHGIMVFSLQNNLWGLSVEKLLFTMLENELFNINAK